jgi:hypothetical protein
VVKKIDAPTKSGDYKFIIASITPFGDKKPYLILLSTADAMHMQISDRLDDEKTPLSKLTTQVFG